MRQLLGRSPAVVRLVRTLVTSAHVIGEKSNLVTNSVHQQLEHAASLYTNRPALIVEESGVNWNFEQLLVQCYKFAHSLQRSGFQHGDRFGVWAPNIAEWTVAQFATSMLGVILVNVNPSYRKHELELALKMVGVKGLMVCRSNPLHDPYEIIKSISTLEKDKVVFKNVPSLELMISVHEKQEHPGIISYEKFMKRGDGAPVALPEPSTPISIHDAINIQFTSGTTGPPKGATLSHRNIANNGYFVGRGVGYNPADRVCIPVPLYHCFGMVMGNLACVAHGCAMVYPSRTFDPLAVLTSVEKYRCTSLYGVPTMYLAQLQHPKFDSFDLSSLRTGIVAGSICTQPTMEQIITKMHLKGITNCYGLTEVSPVCFQSEMDSPIHRRVTTVGRIHPNVECKVVRADGTTAHPHEKGELWVRGYSVMKGYWNAPLKTSDAITHDGWFKTGDLFEIDEEGYARVVGRIKDMIVRGGENIYPVEIESVIQKHEHVSDCAVVGVPCDKYNEQVCAWIIPAQGVSPCEDSIRAYCKEMLSHFKVPKYIIFADAMPMTVTGKIQKNIIREKAAAILKL